MTKKLFTQLAVVLVFSCGFILHVRAGVGEEEKEIIKTVMTYPEAIQMVTDILSAFEGMDEEACEQSNRGGRAVRAKPKKDLCWTYDYLKDPFTGKKIYYLRSSTKCD